MGGEQSKPEEGKELPSDVNPEDENHYFVEELTKVSFRNLRQVSYYWIDPRVYNAENQKYYNQFLTHFKIDSYTSLEALKSELDQIENNELIKVITAASLPDDQYRFMQNEPKIAQMFLFCGNEERAKLLSTNFPKIKGYALKSLQMIQVLKQHEQADHLDIPPCSVLCMLEEDRKLLNRYRLNYFCITSVHYKQNSKEDFIKVAQTLTPEQQGNIENFIAEYDVSLKGYDMHIQALKWAFKDSFYWNIIEKLPKATTDPKKLAYLRLPFTDLYQAIFEQKNRRDPEQLYIVIALNPNEAQRISETDILNNYIIFTSFVKGFTRKTDAIKEFKQNPGSFLFDVTFKGRKREPKLDFGYVISSDKTLKKNVLFNIYNFFQVQNISLDKRTGTLVYGSLAEVYYNRADQSSKVRNQEHQVALLRNYDYIEELIKKDCSQAAILQMSGYFKEALEVYDKKVDFLSKTNSDMGELAKYIILKGDAYRTTQDYEEAEKEYKSITHDDYKLVCLVHLLELYLKKGDEKRAQSIQEQLEQPSIMRKLKEKFPDEGFKAQNYIALQWMKYGKFREALKKYKNIQAEATAYYQYRFEGIPLVHDIFRNMATCQSKLSNHKEALNLLNSTKAWQLECEGESAGLALTETMIQCVYEEIGDQKAKITSENVQYLTQGINLQEKRCLNQSMISISMDLRAPKSVMQSKVNVQPSINTSGVNINFNHPQNVNQSSVNVNPNMNVNQSSVNVNPNMNVNQSSVNVNPNVNQSFVNVNPNVNQSFVNINPNLNVNQSSVNVNPNMNINQSSVSVNLEPNKPVPSSQNWIPNPNVNSSNVNVRI